jgi:hypothetical protein
MSPHPIPPFLQALKLSPEASELLDTDIGALQYVSDLALSLQEDR